MKLSLKLALAFGGVTTLFVVFGFFGLLQMASINENAADIARDRLPSIVANDAMNVFVSNFRMLELQHIIAETQEEMARYSARIQEEGKAVQKSAQEYARYPMSQRGREMYDSIMRDWQEYLKVHDEIERLSNQGKTTEARALLNGASKTLFDSLSEKQILLTKLNTDGANAAIMAADAAYALSRYITIGVIVAVVLLNAAFTVYIVRSIREQLGKDPGELAAIARRVADGDYAVDDGGPKVGVYGNIVDMVTALRNHIDDARQASEHAAEESRKAREAMQTAEAAGAEAQSKTRSMLAAADKLEEVAGIVSSALEELSAQIEQSERGASEQAARVAETATAMEEMNCTVLEVARSAGTASDVSSQTREQAEAGAAVMNQGLERILQVRQESLTLKNDMSVLDEHARSINQIMGVISDIADQTNLLALNAAIEAARAGEAGRGFAVVADEVRKLAEKTMSSTTEVGNAIRAIQNSVSTNMAQVDKAVTYIEQVTEYGEKSGEALKKIVEMTEQTADQVRAIATASEQQSASSEEISQSITQVSAIAGETARAMEEASQALSSLTSQGRVLTGLIEEMKKE